MPRKVRDEIVARHATPRDPLWREPLFWMAGALVAVALIVGVLWVRSTVHDATKDCVKGDHRGPCRVAAQANQKLESLGVAPVTSPAEVPVPTVTKTITQTPAPPSQDSIELAVASYCAHTACGSGPTATQVAQAVATYCSINGRCRGPAGPSGPNGSPGTSGTPGASGASGAPGQAGENGQPGTDGQNATPDQVAAAVAAYCGGDTHPCKGDPGDTGPAGPSGPKGEPGDACPSTITVTPGPLDNPSTPYAVCVPGD